MPIEETPREKLAPLTNCARIRFAQEVSVRQHRCGGDGDQRGDALFVLAGLVWYRRQACEQLARHARTHEYLMHHTAWTACSPHVLAGRRKAVELLHNGFIWLYKSWTVRFVGGASRGAMLCFALLHVSTESDRQIDL